MLLEFIFSAVYARCSDCIEMYFSLLLYPRALREYMCKSLNYV